MTKYEIMYILSAALEEQARKDEVAKLQGILENNKAKVLDTKEWGVKDFASIIRKQTKGYYVILKVNADKAALDEFDRLAKLDQNVLRHLIIVAQE